MADDATLFDPGDTVAVSVDLDATGSRCVDETVSTVTAGSGPSLDESDIAASDCGASESVVNLIENKGSSTAPSSDRPGTHIFLSTDTHVGHDVEIGTVAAAVTRESTTTVAVGSAAPQPADSNKVDLSTATPLDRAIVRQIREQSDAENSISITKLIDNDHLRKLASMRGSKLNVSYFRKRPELFVCNGETEEDGVVCLVSSGNIPTTGSTSSTLSRPVAKVSGEEVNSPKVFRKEERFTNANTPLSVLTPRQRALRELEEEVVSYIETSEQPVMLCRFGGIPSLKKLARTAAVELKKSFFIDRPLLFRVGEETPGNVCVWLATSECQTGGDHGSSKPVAIETTGELNTPEAGDQSTVAVPAPIDPQAPLAMVDAGVLFIYRQTKGKNLQVALNTFGADPPLAGLAQREGSAWRRPFFAEHSNLFTYGIVRSAASIALTEAGLQHAQRLVENSLPAQYYMKKGTLTGRVPAAKQDLSHSEMLQKKVVEFLRSQPEQTSYLHCIAADPQLRKLSIAADIVLRKPYFESLPYVFRVVYTAESTVMVTLAGNKAPEVTAPSTYGPRTAVQDANYRTATDSSLWIQLQKKIDAYFLEGSQRQYHLAALGNYPPIKELATRLKTRIGKEYFLERRKQYVLVDSEKAKAMLVGLTPSYYNALKKEDVGSVASTNSGKSSGSARTGLSYPANPIMRRVETVTVECVLQAEGHSLPLTHLLREPSMHFYKSGATVNESFFQKRPHLFSCSSTPTGIFCVGLPPENNRFQPLEKALCAALNRSPGFRSELGSLICSENLEHLVGEYTTVDIRIAKAFFMSRPEMFAVIQRGSRTEVVLAGKYRQMQKGSLLTPDAGHVTTGSAGEVQDEGDIAVVPAPEEKKEHAVDLALDEDEMAAWEEELADAELFEADAEDHQDDQDTDEEMEKEASSSINREFQSLASGQLSQPPAELPVAEPDSDPIRTEPGAGTSPTAVLRDYQRFSQEQGFAQHQSLSHRASAQPQPWPTRIPGIGERFPGSNAYSFPNALGGRVGLIPPAGFPGHLPQTGNPNPQDLMRQSHDWSNQYTRPATTPQPSTGETPLPDLTAEELDKAEERLVRLAPSLAYALSRKRGGGMTERIVELVPMGQLRSELLQLQLRIKSTCLWIEEDFQDKQGETDIYHVRVVILGQCYGEAKGTWTVARVSAMIDAAARLSLEIP